MLQDTHIKKLIFIQTDLLYIGQNEIPQSNLKILQKENRGPPRRNERKEKKAMEDRKKEKKKEKRKKSMAFSL